MSQRNRLVTLAVLVGAVFLGYVTASAQRHSGPFVAVLQARQEVPVVSSPARGTISLNIDEHAQQIQYELSYSGLQADVTQAHIHIAQPRVNGGIVLWLCQGSVPPPPGTRTPTCPQEGTVSGVLTANDIVPVAAQQIAAGEFDEVVALIRKGLAYANVHTVASPGGEIRGQIRTPFPN